MTENLTQKRRVRGGHRRSLKKTLHRVETILTDKAEISQLPGLKGALTEKLQVLSTLDEDIAALLDNEDDVADDVEEADEYKQKIYSALHTIDETLVPTAAVSTSSSTHAHTSSAATTPQVRLPKLTIRSFDGDVTKWTGFWDSFNSAIHSNTALSEVDKFNYLRSYLDRTAKDAISGLTLTEANYKEAIEILQKRFGCKQQIISKHMDILLNLDPVVSGSVKALRHLYDHVESNIRGLRSLGIDSKTYGSLLSPVLLSKLPSDVRLLVSREKPEGDWTLDELLKALEREVIARERAGSSQTRNTEKSLPTGSTLMTNSTQGTLMTCCYCGQEHPSSNCLTVTDAEERKTILRKAGRCYICLRRGHVGKNCRSQTRCYKCKGRHHSSICAPKDPVQRSARTMDQTKPTHLPQQARQTTRQPASDTGSSSLNPSAPPFTSASNLTIADQAVLLQTALTRIYDPTKPQQKLQVRLILDSGSQHSYITEKAKQALNLTPEGECQLAIAAFGSKRSEQQCCEVVRVGMKTRHGPDAELTLLTVPFICEPLSVQPISLCQNMYSHLSCLELADASDGNSPLEVDLLIGSDYYWQLLTGEIRRGEDGPIAVLTKFGWVLSGPMTTTRQDAPAVTLITTHTLRVDTEADRLKALDDCLHSFWNLESLGVRAKEDPLLEEFNDKIHFENGRYKVSLPWKEAHPELPTNYELALKRLHGLRRRLCQNPTILQEYDRIIQDQVKKGIVQLVEPRTCKDEKKLHYLPHHAVVRQNKETTKVRIVYDASAKSAGPSLNECLHAGPKFNQRILDILLRFRTHKVALTGDVEKAFLMISVAEQDRDVLRFLWFNDVMKKDPDMIELRFARVVFGVSSSPFLLNATIRHHLEKFLDTHPETVTAIMHSIYVDDVVFGAENEESAYRLYRESKEIMREGSFNLRKFTTSCPSLQARIDREEGLDVLANSADSLEETFAKATLGGSHSEKKSEQKILGVSWNTHSDSLVFDVRELVELADKLKPTKRNIISIVGRFYDPLGVVSPVIIRFKILMQEICESQVEWDQPLDDLLANKWLQLVADLKQAQPISVPRCYVDGTTESTSLYGFCDASEKAYAGVIYLVARTSIGTAVRFVVSKTRVAPIRSQTIPRLELLSALLLARLMSTVTTSLSPLLKLGPSRCYTDSQVALYWIQGRGKQWRPFVQNRVNEINKLTEKDSWGHCPGKENPADLPSRGITPLELSVNLLWRCGPPWLGSSTDTPTADLGDMPECCATELRSSSKTASHTLLTQDFRPSVGAVMQCQDFSSLTRLLRVTTHVVRFARAMLRVLHKKDRESQEIDLTDCAKAENLWIIESQSALTQDPKFTVWKRQFNLFIDSHGIWRCGGRLSEADLSYSSKHPVLLCRDHPLTTLIIKNAHERVGHNGVRDTLAEIRSKYWIIKGRRSVRSIVARCVVCRRFEGKSFTAPLPPPLPKFRVQEARPFAHTALDFAGPLHVKTFGVSQSSKMWVCLYTCCVTRAVHLDVVPDMSTETFLRSLKRFCARRGTPILLVSDNAKTFKGAARVIRDIILHPEVKKYCSGLTFEWHFNLEKAPWWGGIFERLIKSMKRCLRKMVGQAHFTHDELLTAVTEIEAILNARPLSYISAEDWESPLTPSHFLCGYRLLSLPENLTYCCPLDDEDFTISPAQATKRVKHLHNVLNHFWCRWRQDYLLELRESHRYSKGKESASQVEVGDIVLLHDDALPRSFWKLARIQELIVGHDEKTRGAVIKVPASDGKITTLRRPLQFLYPLEIRCKDHYEAEESSEPSIDEQDAPDEQTKTSSHRTRRRAAVVAQDGIKACLTDLND